MKIEDIEIREIFDSRGEPTLEAVVTNDRGEIASASVPAGKSRGKNEVEVFTFEKAKKALEGTIKKILLKKNFNSIAVLDQTLITADGTAKKERLGGNTILAISIAFARSLANERKQPLWRVLENAFFPEKDPNKNPPRIFSNLINGGAHANNNLDIQEYMVVVNTTAGIKPSIEKLIHFYKELGEALKRKAKIQSIPIGDEGGYSLEFKDNFEPLRILVEQIQKEKLENEFQLALDVAASNFYKKGVYHFEKGEMTDAGLQKTYSEYFRKVPSLFSIEDPCDEEDLEGFKEELVLFKDKWIVGDDLTTTNPKTVARCVRGGFINAVIIKPNQIGTVTETCEAIQEAQHGNAKVIVSHRSGETEEVFIAHLARAASADGIKIGAPTKERMIKYNELIRIYS